MRFRSSTLFFVVAAMAFAASSGLADVTSSSPLPSTYPVVADPSMPVPSTLAPVTVPLFDWIPFLGYGSHSFSYTPSAGKGPWSKIVLRMQCNCTAGRQFDRTVWVLIANAPLFFGTTPEPTRHAGPVWNVSSDVTAFDPILATAQNGSVELDTVVNHKYNGVLACRAHIDFYPAAPPHYPAPLAPPSFVVPLGMGTNTLTANVSFPRRAGNRLLTVYLWLTLQGQQDDEFFWSCLPNNLSQLVGTCGNTAIRFGEVLVDGVTASIVPAFPYIFTGGIDPFLWNPVPSVRTLHIVPYRVDLTCYAGQLDDGLMHSVQVRIGPASNSFWRMSAVLFATSDPAVLAVKLWKNSLPQTLAKAGSGARQSTLVGNTTTGFALGWANVSYKLPMASCAANVTLINRTTNATVVSLYVHSIEMEFTNEQWYNQTGIFGQDNSSFAYASTFQKTAYNVAGTLAGTNSDSYHLSYEFPLTVIQATLPDPKNRSLVDQETTVTLQFALHGGRKSRSTSYEFSASDHIKSQDVMTFDAVQNFVVANSGQASNNHFDFEDSRGNCYRGDVQAANNSVTSVRNTCDAIKWYLSDLLSGGSLWKTISSSSSNPDAVVLSPSLDGGDADSAVVQESSQRPSKFRRGAL